MTIPLPAPPVEPDTGRSIAGQTTANSTPGESVEIVAAVTRSQAHPAWRKRFDVYGCLTQTVEKMDEQKNARCQELKTGFVACEAAKAREKYDRATYCMKQCNPNLSSGYNLRRARDQVYDPCVARARELRMTVFELACRERSIHACIDFCE